MGIARLLLIVAFCAGAVLDARAEYGLVWAEEFDDTALDAASWTPDAYHGVVRSANDAGAYTDRSANVRVESGGLSIAARQEAFDLAAFTTARVQTYGKRAFTLGRISVRLKAPAVAGLRPQVTLLPVELTYGSWPASGAIDVLDCRDGTPVGGLHFGGSGPRGTHIELPLSEFASRPTDDGFHVYTVEWQPHEIRWLVDGELAAVRNEWESAAAPHPAPFDQPFFLALGLAVEAPAAAQLEHWPYVMEVDWIRVYQAKGNHAPDVTLTAPRPNATVTAGQAVTLRAEATDPDDNLVGVAFYHGDTRLTIDAAAPFEYEWAAPDGCYRVVARAIDQDGFVRAASAEITVGSGCPPTPFRGVAAAIPGRVEAEDFDESLKGEAYYDTDPSNNGGAYRPQAGVDIQPCTAGGFNLGWMIDNEWTRYTVAVTATGKFDVRCRVASPNDTARIHLELDGVNITGSLQIPNTGDWQNFTDVGVQGVHMTAGQHVLRMVVEREGLNLDYVEFTTSRGE